ncbi:MAG: APC family permease [Candidatus Odinarchaeota archaeon]
MSESKKEETLPKRTLTLSQAVIYGIGCGIGGSIFILLSGGIAFAGPGILISLILCGILIFFTGLNYSELSTSLPIAGGAYNFTKEGLGGFLAFIIGFFFWIANIAACSFSAQTFALVIKEILNKSFIDIDPVYIVLISILPLLLTSLVIFRTQKIAIRALLISTIILIGMFIFFIFSGLIISPILQTGFNSDYLISGTSFLGVISAFSLLFLLFTSITSNLAYLNADLKNPSKNIPKTNIYAILITLGIYLSITIAVLLNIEGGSTGRPFLLADVLGNILGPFGFYFMAAAAFISTTIAINAALGSAVSVITALARDRYIPRKIRAVKKRTDMPALALMITAFLTIIFTIFAGIGLTAETTTLIFFIGLASVNYAAVKLRHKRKELDRPFKAPFFPFLPILLFICFLTFAVLFGIIWIEALFLAIIISIIGVAYYLLSIADKPSVSLTLAGIKFFVVIVIGFVIWIVNNFSSVNSTIITINRIFIIIGVFTIGTTIFDLFPLRQVIYYFIKKVDKTKIAIKLGDAQIIELGKKRSKIIHVVNIIITLLQFVSVIFIFSIVYLLLNNVIVIEEINLGSTIITKEAGRFLFISILMFFGIILFFSTVILWYRNRELKQLGI